MNALETLTAAQLETWMRSAQQQAIAGQVADRIPQLAVANPSRFAAHVCGTTQRLGAGDTDCLFALMSAVKPLVLLYLLDQVGADAVLGWVGVEPSDLPFNSIAQLKADGGRPRNPMLNSGAIALVDKLPGRQAIDRTQRLCDWLNRQAGCQLGLDAAMLASVQLSSREPNLRIVEALAEAGQLRDAAVALETYEQVCCLAGRVADLAAIGLLLAGRASPSHRQFVNAVMLTCGLYEVSARYAVQIGLPMKSGVSGALLAVVPRQGAIACYSPALDRAGNSIAGLALVETLSRMLGLSVLV